MYMADAIKVIARIRPVSEKFDDKNNLNWLSVVENSVSATSTPSVEGSKRSFCFDDVLDSSSSQLQVFQKVEKMIPALLDGYNATIMSYGQTSSGKTFTMEGPSFDSNMQGIISRSVKKLFDCICDSPSNIQFTVKVSYFEIYCERVRDLLKPTNTNLKLHEDKSGNVFIGDITQVFVSGLEDVIKVLERGKLFRASAPTLMNAESSRSHSLISIEVASIDDSNQTKRSAKLLLIDLAGSEKISKTGAIGARLEEAKKINTSLTCLGRVITALAKRDRGHVPYRDSKLTRLLTQSLGGNSQTVLIICCAPEFVHADETISTLRFGLRARSIINKTKRNEELGPEALKSLLFDSFQEIVDLRKQFSFPAAGDSVLRHSQRLGFSVINAIETADSPLRDYDIDEELSVLTTQLSDDDDDDTSVKETEDVEGIESKQEYATTNQTEPNDDSTAEFLEKISQLSIELQSTRNELQLESSKRSQFEESVTCMQSEIDALIRHDKSQAVLSESRAQDMIRLQSEAERQQIEIAKLVQERNDDEMRLETVNMSTDDTIQRLIERLTEEQERILLLDCELRTMGTSVGNVINQAKKNRHKRGKSLSPVKYVTPEKEKKKKSPELLFGSWFAEEWNDDDEDQLVKHQANELVELRQMNDEKEMVIQNLLHDMQDQSEAHELVMKAKESVVKSIVSQNNIIQSDHDDLAREADRLKSKVEQLTMMLVRQSASMGGDTMNVAHRNGRADDHYVIRGGSSSSSSSKR